MRPGCSSTLASNSQVTPARPSPTALEPRARWPPTAPASLSRSLRPDPERRQTPRAADRPARDAGGVESVSARSPPTQLQAHTPIARAGGWFARVSPQLTRARGGQAALAPAPRWLTYRKGVSTWRAGCAPRSAADKPHRAASPVPRAPTQRTAYIHEGYTPSAYARAEDAPGGALT